jgi:hypothetical protein
LTKIVFFFSRRFYFFFRESSGSMPACFKMARNVPFGDSGVAVDVLAVPDLMAPGRLSVECKAQRLAAPYDLSIAKIGKASHIRR